MHLMNSHLRFASAFGRILATAACCFSVGPSAGDEPAEPFRVRALHVDNRVQVVPVKELNRLADKASDLGLNMIIMEWEGSYPFQKNHIISNRFAYTPEEVTDFVGYCGERGLEVVPLLQCMGHLEYVLQFERYAHLREDNVDISQVCPLRREEVLNLYAEMLDEIVATHPSKYVHIGADETALLGHCKQCRAFAEEHGKSTLFVRHIKAIAELVIDRGRTPVLWADIVMKHPESMDELPPECVLVDWNYGWDVDHFGDHKNLTKSGHQLWGALALRSHPDNFFRSAWDTHFRNLEEFIPFMRETGYEGVVMTSWSTSGQYAIMQEPKRHVVEIIPRRRVYPMRGSELLLDAYGEAIEGTPFDAHDFVIKYGNTKYGLSGAKAETLWQWLMLASDVPTGNASSSKKLEEAAAQTREARDSLLSLEVETGRDDFEHYSLMSDIRLFFIDVQRLRLEAESLASFPSSSSSLAEKIDRLEATREVLNQRFAELHASTLYPGAIALENATRNKEFDLLRARVIKQR